MNAIATTNHRASCQGKRNHTATAIAPTTARSHSANALTRIKSFRIGFHFVAHAQVAHLDFGDTVGSHRLDLEKHTRRFVNQTLNIHAHAAWRVRSQIIDAACQHLDGSIEVAPRQVMTTDADLKDPLVEIADRSIRFGAPDCFERFVLIPVSPRLNCSNA